VDSCWADAQAVRTKNVSTMAAAAARFVMGAL
jgi:hypothetical protein